MSILKNILSVLGALALIFAAGYAYAKYNEEQKSDGVFREELAGKKEFRLVSQKIKYSDLQQETNVTKATIYYTWNVTYDFGVTFPDGEWDWDIKYNNGIATVTAPKLIAYKPNASDLSHKVIDVSLYIAETDMISRQQTKRSKEISFTKGQLLNDPVVIELAKTKLAEILRDIFNQVNENIKLHKVVVKFAA